MDYFSMVKITCFFVEDFASSSLLSSIFASNQMIFSHRKSNLDIFSGSLNNKDLMDFMQYRPLANTESKLNLIPLGTMTYGEQNTQAEAFEQMDYALAQGINTIHQQYCNPAP
jgi:hypothetical protein